MGRAVEFGDGRMLRFVLGGTLVAGVVLACAGGVGVGSAAAQGSDGGGEVREEVDPRAVSWERMMRRVTVEFEGQPLEEVLGYLGTLADVEIDALWVDERRAVGLERDAEVVLEVEGERVLNVLERVLDEVSEDDFDAATWQLAGDGRVQVGPRSRLNRYAFLKTYYIHDLVFVIPDFDNAPELDLNNVLGGGGGGDSPFEDEDDGDGGAGLGDAALNEDAIDRLLDVIRLAIEPDQWEANGGEGGIIREFRGTMIVRAPAYMHRQLGGFDFEPRRYRAWVNEERLERRRARARGEDVGGEGEVEGDGEASAGGEGGG